MQFTKVTAHMSGCKTSYCHVMLCRTAQTVIGVATLKQTHQGDERADHDEEQKLVSACRRLFLTQYGSILLADYRDKQRQAHTLVYTAIGAASQDRPHLDPLQPPLQPHLQQVLVVVAERPDLAAAAQADVPSEWVTHHADASGEPASASV